MICVPGRKFARMEEAVIQTGPERGDIITFPADIPAAHERCFKYHHGGYCYIICNQGEPGYLAYLVPPVSCQASTEA
jgi:hypothetical protein